jgi:hypothetical protein
MKLAPANLLGHRPFVLYLGARTFTEFSAQVAVVAVGWHVLRVDGQRF